jgi:hypothetical protein
VAEARRKSTHCVVGLVKTHRAELRKFNVPSFDVPSDAEPNMLASLVIILARVGGLPAPPLFQSILRSPAPPTMDRRSKDCINNLPNINKVNENPDWSLTANRHRE